MSLFRMVPLHASSDFPTRPTHFEEDANERAPKENTVADWPEKADDVSHVDYGFQPAPESIPVYLTEPAPSVRPIRRWKADTYVVDNAARPINVLSNDRNRYRAVLCNKDAANSIYLVPDGDNKNTAYARELPAGKDVEMLHNSAVWAFSAVGTPNLVVHSEYELDPTS